MKLIGSTTSPYVRKVRIVMSEKKLDYQFVLEDGKTAHEWVGYTASALVLARVVWGFVGSRHARFSDFFPTPTRLVAHLRALLRGATAAPGEQGVLVTRFDPRRVSHREALQTLREQWGEHLIPYTLHEDENIARA